MELITRKICLLGSFGVGKTSLVSRYIRQEYSEKYLTTVGVKVDTKTVVIANGSTIKLIVWDIAGTDTATPRFRNYLRGAAGYLLVADGTRGHTLEDAIELNAAVEASDGKRPFVGLLNKADLQAQWEIDEERVDGERWRTTSAKTGAGVEEAFGSLAEMLID